MAAATFVPPPRDCNRCPRLAGFLAEQRKSYPNWHNAPVVSFGGLDSRLLIVGLAPGLRGANRTGRPFTGDYAGDLLYATLLRFNFAAGDYKADPKDDMRLVDCRIANAVRCVPPANKPLPEEFDQCRPFLAAEIKAMPKLRVVLALGHGAHVQTLRAMGIKPLSGHPFGHGSTHALPGGVLLADSYHCSRYNTNTGRLTTQMFEDVIGSVRVYLDDWVA